ncbi:MAG: C1 family peptidase [Pseudomonadota bacterium]|nr:C1 family peptidase [Pseudomonadota bacterium]
MNTRALGALGWQRDLPDFRDYSAESREVDKILRKSKPLKSAAQSQPDHVDLRAWCSPIEDQGSVGSCTANAGIGLLEYYQRRAFGKHLNGSRLFLYKVTRNLLGWTGDTGAYLRDTIKAMALFGVPPETYWPYELDRFDDEPTAFCYAFGQSYQTLQYYRHDPVGTPPKTVLTNVKSYLAAGLPAMFGFSVYSSMPGIGEGSGEIPYPTPGERLEGGHAVVAVGYDDARRISGDKGALLIRNSWGTAWGEEGYGWLPYKYVEKGLAVDFWSLLQAEFVDTDLFK